MLWKLNQVNRLCLMLWPLRQQQMTLLPLLMTWGHRLIIPWSYVLYCTLFRCYEVEYNSNESERDSLVPLLLLGITRGVREIECNMLDVVSDSMFCKIFVTCDSTIIHIGVKMSNNLNNLVNSVLIKGLYAL